jgi:hypothetical protein
MLEPRIACISPKFERGIADLPSCTIFTPIADTNLSLTASHMMTQYKLDMVQLPVSLPTREESASWPQLQVRSANLKISQYPTGTVAYYALSLSAEGDTVIRSQLITKNKCYVE